MIFFPTHFIILMHLFTHLLSIFMIFLHNVFFYVRIDMVELAIVPTPDPEVFSVDIVEYFITKEKKKYEDIDEMIN